MGSTLHYAQHLAINLENQTILLPHPKRLWRVFLSPSPRWRVFRFREGDFVRGGRFCTPSPAVPGTTPTVSPSRNISTLQRQIRPPKRLETPDADSPKRHWRAFRYREGVFVRGGRFCTPSPAAPGTTPTFPPSRDNNALPRHFHPPRTLPPSRVNCWTVSCRSCAALKRREYGALKKRQ